MLLRLLARRYRQLDTEAVELTRQLHTLVVAVAPALLTEQGIGTHTAATLLVTAGDNPGRLHRRHRAIEFTKSLQAIDREVPAELEVHLVLDNDATHKTPMINRWLAAHPRFHVDLTPTGSSWLNLVERWFAELTRRQIERGSHRATRALENAIRSYLKIYDEDPKPFIWHKTGDEILASIAHYCQRISDSGHERCVDELDRLGVRHFGTCEDHLSTDIE